MAKKREQPQQQQTTQWYQRYPKGYKELRKIIRAPSEDEKLALEMFAKTDSMIIEPLRANVAPYYEAWKIQRKAIQNREARSGKHFYQTVAELVGGSDEVKRLAKLAKQEHKDDKIIIF